MRPKLLVYEALKIRVYEALCYKCMRPGATEREMASSRCGGMVQLLQTSAYGTTDVSTRQHTSAYVSIRQHTSAYVSIRQRSECAAEERQSQALLRLYYRFTTRTLLTLLLLHGAITRIYVCIYIYIHIYMCVCVCVSICICLLALLHTLVHLNLAVMSWKTVRLS
jgi:hypothetical protein